jgi:voltage-gated sodium channel
MVGHYLFGRELEAAWGSIGAAMMSLVILLTLENFPVYLEDAIAVNALAVPYLLSYVFIIVFTILNLLIGIVLNAMDEARAEAKKRSGDLNEIKLMIQELESVLASGRVAKDDFKSLQEDLERLRSYAKDS